jgi:hypothetical protein
MSFFSLAGQGMAEDALAAQRNRDYAAKMAAARAASGTRDFTRALSLIQDALALKAGEAEAMELKSQVQLAQREQLTAEKLSKAIATAQTAERAGNYTNALAAYLAAQQIRRDDPQAGAGITRLKQKIEDQARADQLRMQTAEDFRKAMEKGQAAEKEGNYTNALAAYQAAQRAKTDDPQVAARIKEISPKAQEQTLLELDARLEVLMVNFGRLSAGEAKTADGKTAKKLGGALNTSGQDYYQHAVDALEQGYKKGDWLSQEQRAEKLQTLKETIKNW